jgi:hypothetical protein
MTIAKMAIGMVLAVVWLIYLSYLCVLVAEVSQYGFRGAMLYGGGHPGVHYGFAITYLLFGAFLVGATFAAFFGRRNGN